MARPWIGLETSWGRLGWFWWRLGAIGRSLGDVLGALGGVLGARLDVLEVFWKALWAMICQDLHRNLGAFRALLWGISEALEASRRAEMAQDALECILGANLGSTWITPWGVRASEASEARGAQACSAKQTEEMR